MVRNTALSWYDVIFVLMLERWVNQSQYDRKVSQFTHYQTFLWWRDEVSFTKWNICVMLIVGVNSNTQYRIISTVLECHMLKYSPSKLQYRIPKSYLMWHFEQNIVCYILIRLNKNFFKSHQDIVRGVQRFWVHVVLYQQWIID